MANSLDDIINQDSQESQAPALAHSNSSALDNIIDSSPEAKSAIYGTTEQQIKTGLESAASAATFGLSKGVEKSLGVKPEDIKAREEENPLSSLAGSAAGIIGSSLLLPGGGAAGVLEGSGLKAGEALGVGAYAKAATAAAEAAEAAKAAGATVKEIRLASKAASSSVLAATPIAQRIGSAAVKGFVENGLFQGGNEVGKMLLSDHVDPSEAIGTAAVNMSLAGLIGGTIGGATGGIGSLWDSKFGSRASKSLEQAQGDLSGETAQISRVPNPEESLKTGLSNSGIFDRKNNASEIEESLSRLGLKSTPGLLEKSDFAQHTAGNLAGRPSIAGGVLKKEQQEITEGLTKSSQEILRDATVKTEAQVGREIKQGIHSELESTLKPIEAEYKSLEPELKKVLVSDEIKSPVVESILNHDYVKADPEGLGKYAEKLAARVSNIKDVNQLKIQRTLLNDELGEAYRSGSPKAKILQSAKDGLNTMRESAIGEAAQSGSIAPETFSRIKAADEAYAGYKKGLKTLGTEGGLGNPNSARALLERFSKISDENFASRIFDTNDINQMRFFKERFPKEFDLARRFKLKEIAEKSLSEAQGSNGKFQIGTFLRELSDKKMNPEAREMLLGGHFEKLQDIKNVFQALPGNPNPSGTSSAEAFKHLFSIQGLVGNATDAVQLAFLKAGPSLMRAADAAGGTDAAKLASLNFARNPGQPVSASAFKQSVDFIANVIKGENLVGRATKNIFKAGETVLPSHLIPDDKSREKLDKKLKHLQSSNTAAGDLLNHDPVGNYLPAHAQAHTQTVANGVEYLNSLRPVTSKNSPLDSEKVVSPMQKATFNNALDIAQQPLIVLDRVKDGTINSHDISHLQHIYPGLYQRLVAKVSNSMMEHVHGEENIPYKTRLGLSKFIAQPLDSTMTPNSIMAAQPQAQKPIPSQQTPMNQMASGQHSMKNINKLAQGYMTPDQARMAHRNKV